MSLASACSPRAGAGGPVGLQHLGDRHVRDRGGHPALDALVVHLHQRRVADTEQRQLVAVGADQEVDADRRARRHRGQRVGGQEHAVDHRQVWQRHQARIGAPPPELLRGGHQLIGRHARQRRPVARRQPEDRHQPVGRALRLGDRVHVHATALHDGAPEEPGRARRAHQRRDAEATGRFPEDRHVVRVPAERRDVVPHPGQGSQLVAEAPVPHRAVWARQAAVTEEPEGSQPVVERHDHDVTPAHEASTPVEEDRAAARREPASVDPHHDRAAGGGRRLVGQRGGPHVQRQAVLALWLRRRGVRRARDAGDGPRLGRDGAERRCVANPVPRIGRLRRAPAQFADGRSGVGNS